MLIHIGKCGGSNITYKFKDYHNIDIPYVHRRKIQENEIIKADHICIMLRDPITRFVSIYYYFYNLYLGYINNQKIDHIETVKKTIKVFEKFPTVEELVTGLTSENISREIKKFMKKKNEN